MRFRKWLNMAVILLMLLMIATACSSDSDHNEKLAGHLKVAYLSQNGFMPQYGNLLEAKFPKVEVEVLEIPFGAYRNPDVLHEFVNTYQPDILVAFNFQTYTYFMEQQLLTNLEPLTKDDFELSDFHPEMLSLWRDGAALMGIPPYFTLEGVIYNTELFQKHQIPIPAPNMTWNELFVTASLFPQEEGIIGLELPEGKEPFALVTYFGEKAGLQWISNDGKQLTIDSPSWMEVFQLAVDAFKNQTGKLDVEPAPTEQFNIAMSTDFIGSVKQIENGWGAIPLPSVANTDNYNDVAFVDFFGIHTNSPNIDLSWEIIKYITGEDWAALKQNADGYISTRSAYIGEVGGVDVEQALNNMAFVKVQAQAAPEFIGQFSQLVSQTFLQIIDENRSVEEALREVQTEGQLLLESNK